ncbi:hypothetical protein HGA91_05470 [candidate division WWE3 bacterium]|nr:hypothetical protein [candidate division WWE3 bacterium]
MSLVLSPIGTAASSDLTPLFVEDMALAEVLFCKYLGAKVLFRSSAPEDPSVKPHCVVVIGTHWIVLELDPSRAKKDNLQFTLGVAHVTDLALQVVRNCGGELLRCSSENRATIKFSKNAAFSLVLMQYER